MVLIGQLAGQLFGQETTYGSETRTNEGVVPATKNRWLGIQDGGQDMPNGEYDIAEYRGGDLSRDAILQLHKKATHEGTLNLILQHAWPIYWALGKVATVDNGDGTYTHTITGSNLLPSATLHQILGDGGSIAEAVDWKQNRAESLQLSVPVDEDLKASIPFKGCDYDDTISQETPTALTDEPFEANEVTWDFYNAGTTAALTGLTEADEQGDTILNSLDYTLGNNLREIRGHKSGTRAPITHVPGRRTHDLSLKTFPADHEFHTLLWKARTKFDFYYRLTRSANDWMEFRFKDCLVAKAPYNTPDEEGEVEVELKVKPRTFTCVVKDSNATLLDATV